MSIFKHTGSGLPASFKDEYLNLIASWLLEEWRNTEDDMVRETDNAYTRGTARFGRQKQRISIECLSGRYPWLRVQNNSSDLVFSIVDIPCRFSNDNADAPKKRATLEVHPLQMSLIEETAPGEAARFVFVLDRGFDEASEPRVMLLGFSGSGQEVCRWTSGGVVRTLSEAKPSLPAPVQISKPSVTPKKRPADDDAAASIGT